MKKFMATTILGLLFLLPSSAWADTSAANSALVQLYTQLVALLQQELKLLQTSAQSVPLTPTAITGTAPFTVLFTLDRLTGKEAVVFGDGHSTGSAGCVRNTYGWCNLQAKELVHTYQFPGTYAAVLIRGDARTVVSTSTVTVQAP